MSDITELVKKALEGIRPALQGDGGDIDFVDYSPDGTVKVKLKGSCCGCPMSKVTLSQQVEKKLKASIPEVKKVIAV